MAKTKGKGSGSPQPGKGFSPVEKAREFKDFFEESKVEIRKVVWPTRKEVVQTSVAVVVFTIVCAVYLGLVDWGWSSLIRAILS